MPVTLNPDLNSNFPEMRMRRLRKSDGMRSLLQENSLSVKDLIYPIFVEENVSARTELGSLPGVYRETEQTLKQRVKDIKNSGIPAIILFGISHNKDHNGSDTLSPDGLLARMIRTAKEAAPELLVIADVCFCEYTDHGHCGPLSPYGDPDNDKTLDLLGKQAVIAAQAGADIIAPSGMIDGMVHTIRTALDNAKYTDKPILSYAAKFASHHYGPFRDAAGCALDTECDASHIKSDRKTYQINPANRLEALREVELDVSEGADMLMVKPGLPYLDIIRDIKDRHAHPLFAYHVSGEYAMLKAAAEKGWIDYESALLEQMLCFKRAGCNGIITYAALDLAEIIKTL